MYSTGDCGATRYTDESGFCRSCADFLPYCDTCATDSEGELYCTQCSQEAYPGKWHTYAPYWERDSGAWSCVIPGCVETSPKDDLYCTKCEASGFNIWAKNEGICTDDCTKVGSEYIDGTGGDAGMCVCNYGFTQLEDGSCCDCREIDDYCVECDAPNHCTKCALTPFNPATEDGDFTNHFLTKMDVSSDGRSCATPTPFCRDSFDDEYLD